MDYQKLLHRIDVEKFTPNTYIACVQTKECIRIELRYKEADVRTLVRKSRPIGGFNKTERDMFREIARRIADAFSIPVKYVGFVKQILAFTDEGDLVQCDGCRRIMLVAPETTVCPNCGKAPLFIHDDQKPSRTATEMKEKGFDVVTPVYPPL